MNEYNGAYKTFAPNWKRILSNACGRNLGRLSRQDSSDAGYPSGYAGTGLNLELERFGLDVANLASTLGDS
jgi:hypothetical protein